MSLLKRFSDILRSNLNALADATSNPEKLRAQSVLDMKEQEQIAKRKLVEITALHKLALKHIETESKALQALDKQSPERAALEERIRQEKGYAHEILGQRNTLAVLLAKMPDQIAKLKRKGAGEIVNDSNAFDTFDRMAEKVDFAEAESEALLELSQSPEDKDLEEFKKMLKAPQDR